MILQLVLKLSEDLLIPIDTLRSLIRSAPHRYKTYYIRKRSNSGFRLIAQPAKEVKILQYWVIKNIFPALPVHNVATAYLKQKGIKNNAEQHKDNSFLLKLDFKNFFPSINDNDFRFIARNQRNLSLDEHDILLLSKILFWQPKGHNSLRLSIGAPSSPILSNAVMFQFDELLYDYCESNKIVYTRYADDMTFSMQNGKERKFIISAIQDILSRISHPKLTLNDSKTIFSSKANRRLITGLIISNDGHVTIGRDKKRLLRSQIHHYIGGKLSKKEIDKLKGTIAFVKSIEPKFIDALLSKYDIKHFKDL
ncbi:retron St85 family RNA-directed DNA polymerase [Desulfoferula mesophila]|uniref:RNA-directed DNA polymerase n=1 Tax=Desulfoferula mesophila TaxID=3058419 RepID=A0AAU9EGX4_9BACT|nr:RNA-directed DNA polymerase [Desulfoferula mesophilus]